MPSYDVSSSHSSGSSKQKTPPPPNRGPILGVVVGVLVLLVVVIAWSLFGSHSGATPTDSGHRVVIQHDPSNPIDLPAEKPATPQGTNAIKSMYNVDNADPDRK